MNEKKMDDDQFWSYLPAIFQMSSLKLNSSSRVALEIENEEVTKLLAEWIRGKLTEPKIKVHAEVELN